MSCFRVKYRIEYDSVNDLYRLPKAPELIKIANDVAANVFYTIASDNEPTWVDIATLQEIYGDQIFFNVDDEKNMLFTSDAVTGTCLDTMKKFIGGESYIESRYFQSAEGEDLIDSYGVLPDLPYVSGFGVNQLFDLSPTSDNRWNKNAYVGNAFALPEYYDFPYIDEIYFDTANPFHWKIKDCHYRYYEEQAVGVTNISFAKLTYSDFGYGTECTTTGVAYGASTAAYGEWEYEIYKETANGAPRLYFIQNTNSTDNNEGYALTFDAFESIRLQIVGVSNLFVTPIDYFQINTFYKIKITRNSTLDEFVTGAIGTIAVYIKGGSFGNTYVLVDVTGGTGTNPVTNNTFTTSSYSVLDNDVGDEIRNYSINGTLQDFYDYTQSTGVYEIDNLKSSDELLLYSDEQVDPELTQIKGYIGLISGTDYYENEEQP